LRRIADGVLVGNAQSELGNQSFWDNATTVTQAPAETGWRLNGKKFYSTGSLFADWIHTTATVDRERSATVFVPAAANGMTRLDDWDGFGQQLTGSGTTLFENVEIHADDVQPYANGQLPKSYLAAFFQLVHLATLTGIGRAAVAEAAAFVRQRNRNLANPAYPAPQDDPQVQAVVGRITGASFAAEATTMAAVEAVEAVQTAEAAGHATPELFDRADAAVYSAQGQVIALVLGLVTELFEVGGASAVTERFRLDRHWRNARTLASHNPVIYRDRIVGDYVLNGTSPSASYAQSWERAQQHFSPRKELALEFAHLAVTGTLRCANAAKDSPTWPGPGSAGYQPPALKNRRRGSRTRCDSRFGQRAAGRVARCRRSKVVGIRNVYVFCVGHGVGFDAVLADHRLARWHRCAGRDSNRGRGAIRDVRADGSRQDTE
jgi:alkylation response protein AidB-like acyl-CoA dehydrogenase